MQIKPAFLIQTAIIYAFFSVSNAYSIEKGSQVTNLWYTVTVANKIHYAYYNETISKLSNRYHYQSKMIKNEEGFINEESVGAFAEATQTLKPLFFNFLSKYRNTETQIDGTIQPDGALMIKGHKGNETIGPIKKAATEKSIFSSMFPLWVQLNFDRLKKEKTLSFKAIIEDGLEDGFLPLNGRITLDPKDPLKAKVEFRNSIYFWNFNPKGWMTRMENPAQQMVIEATTQQGAENFLKVSQ